MLPVLRIHHHYIMYCCPHVVNVVLLTCQESNTKVFVTLNEVYTIIHFFFVAKIFLYAENIRKYLTEYNFTAKIFPTTVHQRPHTSTSLVAAAFISLYSW